MFRREDRFSTNVERRGISDIIVGPKGYGSCNKRGEQVHNLLTKEELSGRKKLEERVRTGKIHISRADKGTGIVGIHYRCMRRM